MKEEKKVVLILDALGTRGIWLREKPDVILKKYSELIDSITEIKNNLEKILEFLQIKK